MQTINLDLTPSSVPSVVHASQFDVGREIGFYLYEDGEEYTIPSGATVYVEGTKSDNHAFSYSSADESSVIVFSGNVVSIATTEQMTAAAGNARCEIKIKTDDATLYTANFILGVESSALPSDSDMSATDIPMIKKAADAGDKIDTLSDKIDKAEELIKQVEDNVTSAETSAANAKTSETNAAASATSASSSASAAETSATNAANSATAAKNSQTSAASYATQAKNQATNAATSATNAATSATASADSAKLSQSWAVGGTSSRSGEDTNNSKYYAEQAAKSAQEAAGSITGVATWNGRAGAVTPQKGDYTADMVGALADDSVTSAYSATGTAPVNGQAVASAISNKADSSTVSALASVVASKADQTALDTVGDNSVTGISISGKTVTITKGDGTTKTATTQDTTYSNATTSAAGLMSASDKAKLNGIATGATKVTVDSELSSSSTNPVQNKAVNSAISTISTEVNARPKTRRLATKSLTASGGTVSWTDSSIGSTSLIDVYASLANIAPTAITQSETTVTVTFDAQDAAFSVAIIVTN